MSDSDEEGLQQNSDVPPAPDSSVAADKNSSELDDAAAEKPKRKSRDRSWVQLGQWDPVTVDAEVINDEISRLAKEKLAEGGISSLHSRKKKAADMSCRKNKDRFINSGTGLSIVRCPVAGRFKCPALLKIVHRQGRVELYMSEMHGVDSHVPAKDSGNFLKFHQMKVIQSHVKVNPTISAAHLRRNIHRTSPEKKIAPEHAR
jgi:hypothetical protein